MKQVTNYKCDACDNGVTVLIHTKIAENNRIEVKNCNSCNKFFGVKSIEKLERITHLNVTK